MNVGDLVRVKIMFTAHGVYEEIESKIAMIIEGPNDVGKVKLLFPDGRIAWRFSAELDYLPRKKEYLKE